MARFLGISKGVDANMERDPMAGVDGLAGVLDVISSISKALLGIVQMASNGICYEIVSLARSMLEIDIQYRTSIYTFLTMQLIPET